MPTTRKKTDDVLASARRELKAQLAVVREEKARLDGEERALTQALSGMDATNGARGSATSSAGAGAAKASAVKQATRKSSARKARTSRRRPAPGKSTADRVEELQGLLGEGPKSRGDLATALGVSPARVQQLLAELGGKVSSQKDPENPRASLWSLKSTPNGGAAPKPAPKRGRPKAASARRRSGKAAAAK